MDIMISRFITIQILNSLKPSKVIGVFGPRRSGKTTLMNIIKEKIGQKDILMVHGENLDVIEIFIKPTYKYFKKIYREK